MEKINQLRKKYPRFVYKGYSYKITDKDLKVSFIFFIEPDISFAPSLIIKNIDKTRVNRLNKKVLDNLVFHLGLMEILSYWKTTSSPEIEIRAGDLTQDQIKWWKDLIIEGMGQFFYENKINFKKPKFLNLKSLAKSTENRARQTFQGKLSNKVLVPMGGGKDSAVTLEILKNTEVRPPEISCFGLNPKSAVKNIFEIANCKNPIIVERKIDKKLLELNQKGFLNGHTPFSAYLAFLSVLLAIVFDYKYIAFSNERSSNEGNLRYLGKIINHQYSKSFKFEKKFREYSKKYLVKDVEYFSFLRPLYEIQIVKLFSRYQKYLSAFLSCNEAFKTYSGKKIPIGKWCGNCPKCLFVFTCLYPFLKEKELIKIFGENLFEKKKLLPIMLELIGERKFKPFECVGTRKESLIAFYLNLDWEKFGREHFSTRLPFLLKHFEKKILPKYRNLKRESRKIMNSWNNQNNLPKGFEDILKSQLYSKK